VGLEAIMRRAYGGVDLGGLWAELLERVQADPADAAALMDMSTILMVSGHRDAALETQQQALGLRRDYVRRHGRGDALTVLALATAGDFMANTPLDFLLAGSDATLRYRYVDSETASLDELPPHDLLFLAVGESPQNRPVLARCADLLAEWKGPAMNARASDILGLTRDDVCRRLADEASICAPMTVLADRESLARAAEQAPFPLIIRPVGSHAGQGLEKVEDLTRLEAYLAASPETRFYVAPFVDYRSADGLFRKQRIAFIGGRAFPSHLAVSDNWMVHYLSAGMAEDAARREEEARWMETFDSEFAVRHAEAFAALHRRLGLDYFGVDCAELADGRLLVFEADVAMIVHDLDPEDVFPYKKPAMRRLFSAFQSELMSRAGKR
jgi:glutathione synthase/RimK-type ligase-like ATP-grasp enzyme